MTHVTRSPASAMKRLRAVHRLVSTAATRLRPMQLRHAMASSCGYECNEGFEATANGLCQRLCQSDAECPVFSFGCINGDCKAPTDTCDGQEEFSPCIGPNDENGVGLKGYCVTNPATSTRICVNSCDPSIGCDENSAVCQPLGPIADLRQTRETWQLSVKRPVPPMQNVHRAPSAAKTVFVFHRLVARQSARTLVIRAEHRVVLRADALPQVRIYFVFRNATRLTKSAATPQAPFVRLRASSVTQQPTVFVSLTFSFQA